MTGVLGFGYWEVLKHKRRVYDAEYYRRDGNSGAFKRPAQLRNSSSKQRIFCSPRSTKKKKDATLTYRNLFETSLPHHIITLAK